MSQPPCPMPPDNALDQLFRAARSPTPGCSELTHRRRHITAESDVEPKAHAHGKGVIGEWCLTAQ
jgi:hypothetical protein